MREQYGKDYEAFLKRTKCEALVSITPSKFNIDTYNIADPYCYQSCFIAKIWGDSISPDHGGLGVTCQTANQRFASAVKEFLENRCKLFREPGRGRYFAFVNAFSKMSNFYHLGNVVIPGTNTTWKDGARGGPLKSYDPLKGNGQVDTTKGEILACIICSITIPVDWLNRETSEKLDLIRDWTGNSSQIVLITAEPLPTRMASILLGGCHVDFVCHASLPMLEKSVKQAENGTGVVQGVQEEVLQTLIVMNKLRNITCLPSCFSLG